MALILNIDTATERASVCLSRNEVILARKENQVQKEHASFIHEAIKEVVGEAVESLHNIDAVAVTSGPGSYTGLRVGMATAKGLCYVLKKPLLTISTLEVMVGAAINKVKKPEQGPGNLFCPMIDARRMEVFTALYTSSFQNVLPPCAMILEPSTFDQWLNTNKIFFMGSGSEKFENLINHPNATFLGITHNACDLSFLSQAAYQNNEFADLAYSEPLYIKDFHTTQKQ